MRLAPVLLAFLCGCASRPPAVPTTWTLPSGSFLSATGEPLSDGHVVAYTSTKDFILVGESHTNPCDHAVQAHIIEILAQSGMHFSIGLEMLPVTAQPVLERFNAGRISPHDLGREVGWEKLWGHPYAQYLPIFEKARAYGLPVVALNIPRKVVNRYRDQGTAGLDEGERNLLPRRIVEASPVQRNALLEQVDMHQKMREAEPARGDLVPSASNPMASMAERFFLVQALWDSMMAEQALAWRSRLDLPMLILAGSGHVEHGWGIEYRLQTLDAQARCLSIMPVRDREDFQMQADASQRALPGDSLFFSCPSQHKSRLGMNIVFESGQLKIDSVDTDSLADRAGMRPGDVLIAAGGNNLTEVTDLHFAAMASSRQKKPLQLTVRRANQDIVLHIPLD